MIAYISMERKENDEFNPIKGCLLIHLIIQVFDFSDAYNLYLLI